MMNEDVPYEYQMKPILASYDRLVSENQNLKNRIAELEKTLEKERSEKALKADAEFNNRSIQVTKRIFNGNCIRKRR